jgi:hypothetical protein
MANSRRTRAHRAERIRVLLRLSNRGYQRASIRDCREAANVGRIAHVRLSTNTLTCTSPLFIKTAVLQVIVLPVVYKWNPGGRAFQNWFMDNLTWGSVRAVKRIVDIMHNNAKEIYEGRKKALETGSALEGSGKDILTILSTPSPSILFK